MYARSRRSIALVTAPCSRSCDPAIACSVRLLLAEACEDEITIKFGESIADEMHARFRERSWSMRGRQPQIACIVRMHLLVLLRSSAELLRSLGTASAFVRCLLPSGVEG